MTVKAKHRTKIVPDPAHHRNGNGFHNNAAEVSSEPAELHPLFSIAGSYKDDPFWDEFIQIMKDERQKELEQDLKNLEDEP